MKSFKNIISLVVLAGFVFFIPLKTNALTIEDVIKNLNDLQPSNISNIKDAVNYYDYQENIDEINSILNESLISSKYANNKLDELNNLMNSINDKNIELLSIKDKEEYDKALDILKEEVELAKQLNSSAKTSSQKGLDKYNVALEKYASLKSELEDKKEKVEAILNANIMATNIKLDAINSLLEELEKIENKLKKAYDEANNAYLNAKENATIANNNFSEKLEELKEYVEVNGEDELNDLIQANTKYITSGILYASSQIALKLIDVEIGLIEAEIENYKNDLLLLDNQLETFENAIIDKEENLSELNTELEGLNQSLNNNGTKAQVEAQLENAEKYLDELKESKTEQTKCSEYMPELKSAIESGNAEKVVELLLKNEKAYGFTERNIKVETKKELNSSFELVDYIIVTDIDTSKEYVYSYEENNGIVTIYNQNKVEEHEVSEITGNLTIGKYLAYLNGEPNKIISVDKAYGFYKSSKLYSLTYENGWKATTITDECENYKNVFGISICTSYKTVSYDVIVTEAEHYERGNSNHITSETAVNKCTALENNTIDNEISLQETLITALEEKLAIAVELEQKIDDKKTEIDAANSELAAAQAEYENQKNTITNEDSMTYAEIETEIANLEDKLNHYPTLGDEDLESIEDIYNLINELSQGNVDVQSIFETINNLNVGLNIKRKIINEIDKILANNYNNVKQELIEVVGEDIEIISDILKDLAPIIEEVINNNLKLLEEKAKFEYAKANYNALKAVEDLVLEEKNKTIDELEELENLKENNNFDLSELDTKFKEAEENLVSVNKEVEVNINDFVENKNENNNDDNDATTDKDINTDNTDSKDEIKNNNENELIKKEEKLEINDNVEIKTTTDKTDIKEQVLIEESSTNALTRSVEKTEINNNSEDDTEEMSEVKGFNWLNLLWLFPVALIIFFIIFIVKKRKDEE